MVAALPTFDGGPLDSSTLNEIVAKGSKDDWSSSPTIAPELTREDHLYPADRIPLLRCKQIVWSDTECRLIEACCLTFSLLQSAQQERDPVAGLVRYVLARRDLPNLLYRAAGLQGAEELHHVVVQQVCKASVIEVWPETPIDRLERYLVDRVEELGPETPEHALGRAIGIEAVASRILANPFVGVVEPVRKMYRSHARQEGRHRVIAIYEADAIAARLSRAELEEFRHGIREGVCASLAPDFTAERFALEALGFSEAQARRIVDEAYRGQACVNDAPDSTLRGFARTRTGRFG